jgi:DNA-binding response OmpR family regulator
MSAVDRSSLNAPSAASEAARRKRVLVVEDECLIAMMMAEQVAQLGYTVVGPAFTISEARDLAVRASIDGALLDMNLDGILSHEIADILSNRQIPFAFITGYNEAPAGFGPFTNIDVLHKPFQLIDLGNAIEAVLAKVSVDGHM